MSNPLGMTQVASAEVITAADKQRAGALGHNLDTMLSNGEDISEILKEVRE